MSNPIRRMQALVKDQRGVTDLETAIILIAFVVVASVFALTVLSTGIFSAERGKETIHAGLKEARSSAELLGSVIALGVADKTLSKADAVWLAQTNVTGTATTTDKKEGTGSAQLVVAAGFSTCLVAYEDLASTVDLSSVDSIQLWVKSSTTTSSGDLELLLDDTAGCGSTLENVDLPALVADTWKEVTVAISVNDDMSAIKCVGLNRTINESAEQTYRLDDIYGRGQATSIVLTLTNALEGEPLDLFEPSDSDANGISDSDSNQHVSDIYWSQTFIGENAGDNLLESGEKAEVTVTMSGLAGANPIVKDTRFDLELRPQDGGVMVIQRTMPDSVDEVMNLN